MNRKTALFTAAVLFVLLLFPANAMADAAVGGEHGFQTVDYYVIVDAPDGYVNFRYGPGLEYGIYMPIYNGEVLHIVETAENYYDGLSWGQTFYDGYYGWVSLTQVSDYYPDYSDDSQPEEYGPVQPDYQAGAKEAIWIEPAGDSAALVSDAYRYERTDSASGNRYTLSIPRINIFNEEYDQLNEILYEEFSEDMEDSVRMLENGEPLTVDDMLESSYEWFLNDDILSLVILQRFGGPWHEYSVMNLSISENRMLENSDIYERAGYSKEQYESMVSAAMDSVFVSLNSRVADTMNLSEEETALFEKLRKENRENVSLTTAFLDKDGRICFIAPIQTFMTQNSYSWTIIDLESGNTVEFRKTFPGPEPEQSGFNGQPVNYYMYVNAPDNYCNLRKGPGIEYDIITPVYNGEYLNITEEAYNYNDGLYWGRTVFNGQPGWISISQAGTVLP